ncbi:hypothetical protein M8494_07650 [Serratia ureilytica]
MQAVTDGALYQLIDMRHWLREDAQGELEQPVPGWQSTLVQRLRRCGAAFPDAVATRARRKPAANRHWPPSGWSSVCCWDNSM